MDSRVMIASRGADARRVMRAVKEAGMESAVLVTEQDDEARWSEAADYTLYVIPHSAGPDKSPLWPTPVEVVGVALDAGCDIVHPGWGMLARSAELAGRLQGAGIICVGPGYPLLALASDRARVRGIARQLNIPVVPGSDPVTEASDAAQWIALSGFPVIAKVVDRSLGIPSVSLTETDEAQRVVAEMLQSGAVLLERQVVNAREVEVLVVGDGQGEALTLGEAETSIQVNRQRLLAESPAPELPEELGLKLRERAATLVSELSWAGLVAVRFLVTPDSRGYLLQLSAGLQPWHGLTELSLGVDLVDAQLRIARGEKLGWEPEHLETKGHSLCLRFFSRSPAPAKLKMVSVPENTRLDWGFEDGDTVMPGEEIGALIVNAPTRQAAIVRARAALDRLQIEGVQTDIPFFRRLFDLPDFWTGPLDRDRVAELLKAEG